MKLPGARVWIVGASSGIGAALARELAAAGCRLALSARRRDALESLARECGSNALAAPLDVTEPDALDAVADRLRDDWGSIDLVIYSAGAWTQMYPRGWDGAAAVRQAEVNYVGFVRAVGAVLPAMVERDAGRIAGITSIAGYAGLPGSAAYGSTKAAMHVFLQSLRIDLRDSGVGITTIAPGFVRSELTEKNTFPMPFLMDADEAAGRIVDGLRDDADEIAFPRRAAWPVKAISALPRPLYEALARRLPAG